MPKIYDSGDPSLPNLPQTLEYGSDLSDNETVSSLVNKIPTHDSFNIDLNRDTNQIESVVHKIDSQVSKKKKHRKRKNRKYSDSAYSSAAAKKRISWEPGIDIATTEVVLSSIGSSVTVTDYNASRYRVEHIDVFSSAKQEGTDSEDNNNADPRVLQGVTDLKRVLNSKPTWAKVRWINVNGLSWEAIASIGEHYGLHRLAIEDMIDIPQRTKIDLYSSHLFGVLPLMKLVRNEFHPVNVQDYDSLWNRILKYFNLYDYLKEEQLNEQLKDDENKIYQLNESKMTLNEKIIKTHEFRRLNDTIVLKKDKFYNKKRMLKFLDDERPLSYRNLFVGVEQVSFFLLKEGSIISFFESSGSDVQNAILSRIATNETILSSCDVSILLQSIIDAVVDIIYPIITAYRKRLGEYEVDILTNPNIKHTQSLHLMSGELSKLRRTILPTTALINSLKDHSRKSDQKPNSKTFDTTSFMSPLSEIYLSDVSDHTQMFTDEVEDMINRIENLVGLIFNTISTESNTAMQQLSLVTVIFLPLSFWTGYYGMNFEKFDDLTQSVTYYWKIAVPFSAGLLILITWNYLCKTWERLNIRVKRKVQDIRFNRSMKELRERRHEKFKHEQNHKKHNIV